MSFFRLIFQRLRIGSKIRFVIRHLPTLRVFVYGLFFWTVVKLYISFRVTQHIGLISATYFQNSTMYPPNSMVLLFNSQRSWWPQKSMICESISNDKEWQKDLARVRHAHLPNFVCSWTPYIAICQVTSEMIKFMISDTNSRSKPVPIPFRKAYSKKYDVISCFSPLFYNERWQLMIPSLEIYRQFGVGLQVYYIQSVRTEIYDFLMAYKNAGAVEVEPWTLLDLGNNQLEDPNQNLEWRNQAGAHTDCFLKYREAADFIIVSDIDDVLVPKLGKTYIEEFNFLNDKYPSAAGFLYNRYNTQLYSTNSPMDFSLYHLLRTSSIATEWEDGKSVVKTSEVQTVWLHWPAIMKEGRRMHLVSEELNFMIHMRNWTMFDGPRGNKIRKKRTILHDQQMKNFISKEKSLKLELEAKKFIIKNAKREFELLPTNMVYYPLIEECYNRIFYSKSKNPDTCPGPLQCELPIFIPRVKCTVAKRKLVHKSISKHLQIHFSPTKPSFMFLPHGCRMKFSIN